MEEAEDSNSLARSAFKEDVVMSRIDWSRCLTQYLIPLTPAVAYIISYRQTTEFRPELLDLLSCIRFR